MSSSAVVCWWPCLMSPRYSSLPCQCEELFSKLLANTVNTLSDFLKSPSVSWCLKVTHLSVASMPPEYDINLCFLLSVGHCVAKLHLGGEMFPCPQHANPSWKAVLWYWYGCHAFLPVIVNISLWEDVMVLQWERLQKSLTCFKWLSA